MRACVLDNHESTVGVFIDLKKAFDTVDHGILIEKVYHYDIRGIANKWMCSYLINTLPVTCVPEPSGPYGHHLVRQPKGGFSLTLQ